MAGKKSPPLGGPGPRGQPKIWLVYTIFRFLCLEDGVKLMGVQIPLSRFAMPL